MKTLSLFTLMICAAFSSMAQATTPAATDQVKQDSIQVVEASCGECKFDMKGSGCNLAVRIKGVPYFVDGTKIDSHGDAHADDGFCNKIRKARVSGSIVNNRFVATSFKLLPEDKPNQ